MWNVWNVPVMATGEQRCAAVLFPARSVMIRCVAINIARKETFCTFCTNTSAATARIALFFTAALQLTAGVA
jgi:hypothetical protein